jgi:hypothetical protein
MSQIIVAHNITHECGPSYYGSEMLGVQFDLSLHVQRF